MPYTKLPRGKIVRRLGVNIFGNPKYNKILEKKPNGPGKAPGKLARVRKSDYGTQLTEKQKIRYCYGLSEKQFRNTFYKAKKKEGITGENFIRMLESRFDNIIYRLGWAVSRQQARQMVSHKYFIVNGRSANIPSMILKPGDQITVTARQNIRSLIRNRINESNCKGTLWLDSDNDNLTGSYKAMPGISDAAPSGDLQAIIEYYSR